MRRPRDRPAARKIVLVPPVAEHAGDEKPAAAPPRTVIPGTPPDVQAPAPNRMRPNLFVLWFGSRGAPAMEVPPESTPPVSLDTRDLGRVRDILTD